jgi:hypothetical protein
MTADGANAHRSTTVRITLTDGTPRGLRYVELFSWIGLVLLSTRAGYPAVREQPEFDRPGVYLLRGPGGDGGPPRLYVGQADNARERLDQHARRLAFWTDLALFTSKDGYLHKAHVQHVESRLIALANAARLADVANGNAPRLPHLPPADRADAEAFLRETLLLCPLLGYDFFEPLGPIDPPPITPNPGTLLTLSPKGATATARQVPAGLRVLAGAVARGQEFPGMSPGYRALRADLIARGVLRNGPDGLTLTEDWVFDSPSAAATVLLGSTANGWRVWKDPRGRSLEDLRNERNDHGE